MNALDLLTYRAINFVAAEPSRLAWAIGLCVMAGLFQGAPS